MCSNRIQDNYQVKQDSTMVGWQGPIVTRSSYALACLHTDRHPLYSAGKRR